MHVAVVLYLTEKLIWSLFIYLFDVWVQLCNSVPYLEKELSSDTLFQHPELNALIMRRFSEPGDVETARHYVAQVCDFFEILFIRIYVRLCNFYDIVMLKIFKF